MASHGTFCTVFDCMDGRCQASVGAWAREHFGVEYPDTITIAGADGVLSTDEAEWERALAMAHISAEKHGSAKAIVVGHSGCAGYPVSAEEHHEAIAKSAKRVGATGLFDTVVGLYHDVDADQFEEVCRA